MQTVFEFEKPAAEPALAAGLHGPLAALTRHGVRLGTSSWKYPGWLGSFYRRDRYSFRGRFSGKRFEEECLSEYAETFPTVCVDAAYYMFPSRQTLDPLMAATPAEFQFAFKVTDEITVKRFPQLARFGDRAGQRNAGFLRADLFVRRFLEPLEQYKEKVGPLIFEFSRFSPTEYPTAAEFVQVLEPFLCGLPGGWRYGVEIRNREFLVPEYFRCLAQSGVAHVFNAWEAMPPLAEQLDHPDSRTAPWSAARLLLKPGRRYEEAVRAFQPYTELKDPYPEGRAAAMRLILESLRLPDRRQAFVYVNNRFEGNALKTIVAILAAVAAIPGKADSWEK